MVLRNRTISRPFYAIDNYYTEQFFFIYLDEGDNPKVYETIYEAGGLDFLDWIYRLNPKSLSELINQRIDRQNKVGIHSNNLI